LPVFLPILLPFLVKDPTQFLWLRFDFQVFSAEIRRIKREPEIYRYCLELLDCSPEQAIFIDDRAANVAAARNEGIVSLLYRSTDQLRRDLEVIGFDVLPAQAPAAS
jgi:FMN phosphatase YigB (HAD superfamily)